MSFTRYLAVKKENAVAVIIKTINTLKISVIFTSTGNGIPAPGIVIIVYFNCAKQIPSPKKKPSNIPVPAINTPSKKKTLKILVLDNPMLFNTLTPSFFSR